MLVRGHRLGGGNCRPRSAHTLRSIITASASSCRLCRASRRGLSGIFLISSYTTAAPIEPINTTQRQPSKPSGLTGISSHASSATTGTTQKVMNWLMENARPRSDPRNQLGDIGVDGHQLHREADTRDEAPKIEQLAGALEGHARVLTYQTSDQVNTGRRPKRSSKWPLNVSVARV